MRLKAARIASMPPRSRSTAASTGPVGAPPLPPMMDQNIEWLAWPPALFRSAVRMASGVSGRRASSSGTGRAARVPWSFNAVFRLAT